MLFFRLALLVSLCYLQDHMAQAANPVVSLMMKQYGLDQFLPPEPPKMPEALKKQLEAPQKRLQAQRRLQAAKLLRYRAMRQRALREDSKKNPYSSSYRNSNHANHVVYSPANAVRRPGQASVNSVTNDKGNPYGSPAKTVPVETKPNPYSSVKSKNNPNPYSSTPSQAKNGNPYASSRAVGVSEAQHKALTHKAEQLYRKQKAKAELEKKMKSPKSMASMVKKIMDQPKKEMEAMAAGCMKMSGGLAAVATMQNCRNPVLQGMCMTMPQTPKCVNVGVGAMCCPFYMSETGVQAVSYFNKMQKYQQQMMRFMENFM